LPPASRVQHYENFPVASIVLPRRLRRPVEVIYAYARSADDIADEGSADARTRLAGLDQYLAALDRIEEGARPAEPMFADLHDVVAEWRLPLGLLRDLIDAFRQDVTTTRYATYGDLLDYSRRSANPVGRLLLHLYGKATDENLAWSDAICSALQFINFWQDVGVDLRKGRIYVPLEDLARHGVHESEWGPALAGDRRFVALMAFEVARSRALLWSGAPLCRALGGRAGIELRLTLAGGDRILRKIEQARYDVFTRRPTLGGSDWLRVLLRALTSP
jgi:squalene synthase HpnC